MRRAWFFALLVLPLAACTGGGGAAPVTVTVTQTVTATPTAASEGSLCDSIRTQRDLNLRLSKEGYSEDYSDNYNQMLDSMNCTR